MRRIRRALPVALVSMIAAASVITAPPAIAGRFSDEVSRFDQQVGADVAGVEALLTPAGTVTSALPVDPQQALIDATAELSADLGFPQDPTSAILLAHLPDEVAGRLANVLETMTRCNAITQAHWAEVQSQLEQVAWDGGDFETSQFADVRECALALWTATTELEIVLTSAEPSFAVDLCRDALSLPVDVWPVLRFESFCTQSVYANDYLLTVDLGGNDVYSNNQGSNMVDLNYAPVSSTVAGRRGFGPARGCQQAIAGLRQNDCVPAVAVLLDVAGSDTYGVLQSPDLDARCTPSTSRLIRRMVTGGVGFLGVGILRDSGTWNDTYTSKTVSLGAGHIFGVGVLSDAGGWDTYRSIRNSQGFALVGGVGILRDESGNDSYDYYMPPALNPAAQNQTDGAGGVLDDESRDPNKVPPEFDGACDRIPRFTQGVGNVGAGTIGIFVDDEGQDTYRGAYGPFAAPGQVPSPDFGPQPDGHIGGSLGFAANGAAGIFLDVGGSSDVYNLVNYPADAFVRWDNRILAPGQRATGVGGIGLYVDR